MEKQVALKSDSEIIHNINEIYKTYKVPKVLENHMIRVAGIGAIICKEKKLPEKETKRVIAALLLHDIANIVKFNLQITSIPETYPGEKEDLRIIQKEIRKKFGDEEHEANLAMITDIAVNKPLHSLLKDIHYMPIEEVKGSADLLLKICRYSDGRVTPFGIVGLEERRNEIVKRYFNGLENQKVKDYCESLQSIEKELFTNTKLEPKKITNQLVNETIIKILGKPL